MRQPTHAVSMFRAWFQEHYCVNSSVMANYEQYCTYWVAHHPSYPPVGVRWFMSKTTKYVKELSA